jgi:hypothetical protein
MGPFVFTTDLYLWESRAESWVFANLPHDIADDIEDSLTGPRRGFGAVKVEVAVGDSRWRTSIFPSKSEHTFVLPVKRAILTAENLAVGDTVQIELRLVRP